MKKIIFFLSAFSVTIFACNSADQQAPQMAQDFCNCFSPITNKLSTEAKDLIIRSSNNPNYAQAMTDEMNKLSEEDRVKVSQELMVFQGMQDPNSSVNTCVKGVEEKYKSAYTTDKDAFMKKIVSELEKKKGCEITASLMKFGLAAAGQQNK